MFPLGDSPNPRGIAWVNWIFIAANVAVYVMLMPQMSTPANPADPRFHEYIEVLRTDGRLPENVNPRELQLTEYDLTVFEHGCRPAVWTWLSMLTSMFLHGGFMHLFGNMLFLWIYGNNVEHRLGRLWYVAAYLGTGFAASFGDILLRPDSNVPGVGASGAISGVLGMYFIWFPRNRVRLLMLTPAGAQRIDLGARMVLGFYIVAQNILPAILAAGQGGGGGGIAYGAHIGGFIGGIVVAFLVNWGVLKTRAQEPEADEDDEPVEVQDPRITDATHAVRIGDRRAAAGDPHGALAAYEHAIRSDPTGDAGRSAHVAAARVLAGPLNQPTMAYQHVVAALIGNPSDRLAAEAKSVMDEIRPKVHTVPLRLV